MAGVDAGVDAAVTGAPVDQGAVGEREALEADVAAALARHDVRPPAEVLSSWVDQLLYGPG